MGEGDASPQPGGVLWGGYTPSPRWGPKFRLWRAIRRLTRPHFQGFENFPLDRPVLMVGNHTMFGVFDTPILVDEIYKRTGVAVRAMVDRVHFHMPGWRELIQSYGVVKGSPDVFASLARHGEVMLVFPGGSRESSKRRDEKYQLVWGRRTGFARLAIEHGCTIVPFAQVGLEDVWRIVLDADDLLSSPLGRVWRSAGLRTDLVPPLLVGNGPLWTPSRERFYYDIGPPISTAPYADRADDREAWLALRGEVATAIEASIERLLCQRALDLGQRG